jgi:hypothetical protein
MSHIARPLVPAAVLGALAFHADPPPSPLAGTWTLVAADRIGADGVRRHDYGEHAAGRMIVDREGRYVLGIYSAERPRFAAGVMARGTADELGAAVLGQSAHFGVIAVDSAHHTLRFRIERASFPNWEGTEQVREYRLDGDELTYQVPASASGNGTIAISVWRRVR